MNDLGNIQNNPTQPTVPLDTSEPLRQFSVWLYIAVFALIAGFLVAWYVGSSENRLSQARAIVSYAIKDANGTFWITRDYDAATRQLEQRLADAANAGLSAECSLKLELASKQLRLHQADAVRLYAEVFNNQDYSVSCRANALSDTMWHSASHYGDGSLDLSFIRTNVFSPQAFGSVLPDGTKINNDFEVYKALLKGFEAAYKLSPSHVSGVMIARMSEIYLEHDRTKWHPEHKVIQRIKARYEEAVPLLEAARKDSEDKNQYSVAVLYSLNNAFTGPLWTLALAGAVPRSAVYAAGEQVFDYANRFEEAAFSAPVFRALAGYKYACFVALTEERPLNSTQVEKVKSVLEYFYNLPKEDLNNRRRLRVVASNPDDICYEPLVYIANTIDPRLKQVLIEDVGGWTEENFR